MKNEFEQRTFQFSVRIIHFVDSLPHKVSGSVIGRQLLRAGTSIGANYREAQRAESRPDFAHKIALAEKEAAETEYWLMLCVEASLQPEKAAALLNESRELLAILVSIGRKAKRPLP